MTPFRCVPMETEIADRFRCTGSDDNGNALRRIEASSMGSFPCRHCLRCAALGETMLLGSYNLPRPRGIYWTPSPIFLHAASCALRVRERGRTDRSLERSGVGPSLR